jgi:very-short-patch-repair endonuclease
MTLLPYNKRLKLNSRSLRSNMTDAEQHLWQYLRRKQINGWQFYRQKLLGAYIVDFYCAAAQLVVELDGSQHFEVDHQRADQQRDAFLQSLGLRVLRFDNRQVLLETDAVLEVIRQIPPSPPFSKGGECRTSALASIDSSPTTYANASENQALPNTTNATQSLENPAIPVPTFEKGRLGGISQNPATPVPPFEKGGLGVGCRNTTVLNIF